MFSLQFVIECDVPHACTSSSGPATIALWGSCASSLGLSLLHSNMGGVNNNEVTFNEHLVGARYSSQLTLHATLSSPFH